MFAGRVRLDGPRGPVEVVGAGEVLSIRLRSLGQITDLIAARRALRRSVAGRGRGEPAGPAGGTVRVELRVADRTIATWRSDRSVLGFGIGRWRPDPRGLLGRRRSPA